MTTQAIANDHSYKSSLAFCEKLIRNLMKAHELFATSQLPCEMVDE